MIPDDGNANEMSYGPEVVTSSIGQAADGSVTLPAAEAELHGGQIKYETAENRKCIGVWLDPNDWCSWQFKVGKGGKFTVSAELAALGSGGFTLDVAGATLKAKAPVTGDYGKFETVELGTIELKAAGQATLAVKAVAEGWKLFNLRVLKLSPAK